MNKPDEIELARRRAKMEEFKLFPLALFGLLIMGFGYWLAIRERLSIGEFVLYGSAKYIWALSAELLYGSALVMASVSLSLLICLSLLPKYIQHSNVTPTKPLIFSIFPLAIAFGLLALAKGVNHLVLTYSKEISSTLNVEHGLAVLVLYTCWFMVFAWVGQFLFSIIFWSVRAPFNIPEILRWFEEQRNAESEENTRNK